MSTALVEQKKTPPAYAAVGMASSGAGGMLVPQNLGEVVAFATVMARANIALPKFLRGDEGACMAVAMQAMRWEMDPFAVANKSYSVNDRLAYEAQLVAAVVHTRAPIIGRPNYIYTGAGATRQCQVVCVMKDGEEREYTSPTFAQILTKNSPLWKSDPDQQLGYFAIRSWARRHAPEVVLGVYTHDEVAIFQEVREIKPATSGLMARLTAGKAEAIRTPQDIADASFVDGVDAQAEIDAALAAEAAANHDPNTGEIIEANLPGHDDQAQDEGFPGDPGYVAPQALAATPKVELPEQAKPTIAQRLAAFETRCAETTSSTKLKALRKNVDLLFDDMDQSDPEERVAAAMRYEARLEAVTTAEREAAQ